MSHYQALYLTPDGTQLSDVSVADLGWREEEYDAPDSEIDAEKYGPWWTMAKSQPAKAFLIHSCCWSLLTKHFPNEEVNLDRLFEVCRNRPSSRRDRYKSEHLVTRKFILKTNLLYIGWDTGAGGIGEEPWYPLQRPIIRGIGDATKQLSRIQRLEIGHSNKPTSVDCFSLLPMEIRLEIASYLSTADFFGLRSVSRAMAVVFSLQSFWKTRFRINSDRGFLACLTDIPRSRQWNWRSIYRCTARIDRPYRHLWALRRHWMNNLWLADRYSMTQALKYQTHGGFQNNLLGEITWKEAAAAVRCDRNYVPGMDWNKCKNCWGEHIPLIQSVSLQEVMIGLVVFILDEPTKTGTKTYITGFDLISAAAETPNATIGYRLPGRQVTINLHNQELRGFTVVTGDGGIHAIRPIFNNKIVTTWIGRQGYDKMCNSTQILLKDGIKVISAKFDVSRLCYKEPYTT
ncbi:unnamed protein product [Penicillium nalgiovense]|nr:unnamed protein product [Penicillium nalgiovense]